MVPFYVVILFGVAAALFVSAIAVSWRRARASRNEGPMNKASTILATAGGVTAGSSIVIGIAYQGFLR